MRSCPFRDIGDVKRDVMRTLWWANIKHINNLRTIGDRPLEQVISEFKPENTLIKWWKITFKTILRDYTGEHPSIPLTLSKLWYSIYLHLSSKVEGVSIENNIIYIETTTVANVLWLLYYALQPFDIAFSEATSTQMNSLDWLKKVKKQLMQIASIPNGVQKAMVETISLREFFLTNIRSILSGEWMLSRTRLRAIIIQLNIEATKEYKNWEYWICPALQDGTLEIIFDLLVPIYKLSK